ncbi:MAG: cupin domain-containing protein [Eggerthellaceae bacterium]|nr:cupin domain-containing protein [Eggerthellaceae bacterium]
MIHLVLLSGGSGTRLWPLSNDARSKQFLKVLRDEHGNPVSMVQRVFSQIERVKVEKDVTIATCASQQASIEAQVPGGYRLVLEPERRDTAPAIMLACAHLLFEQGANPSDTVIVMPIDTFAEQAYYDRVADLHQCVQADSANIVLLGVEPTYPSSKFGYVVPSSREGLPWPVERFKEKPDPGEAADLMRQGALWNCGVFAFRLRHFVNVIADYVDVESFESLVEAYSELPKRSVDYEVIEKAKSIAVIPYSGEWRDLGTWNALCDEMEDATAGRVVVDEESCNNVHVVNETGLPMVVAGLSDSVVVATPDGILVSGKEASSSIKEQVGRAAESRPMYEQRRWGEYRVLDSSTFPDGSRSLTKELLVKAGRQLSYQRHARRLEVWTVVSGEGEVVVDGMVIPVSRGSVIDVPAGTMHSVRAFEDLHIIEVQLGDALIENDIERFGDYWSN